MGLENLVLLNDKKVTRLSELSKDTFNFFKKLSGYQTLRILLCKKAVLVEGDSDELIFQKAYMDNHNGRLPIEDGIDVISVALTFERFLDIAVKVSQPICVITDNDGNYEARITKKYQDYVDYNCVKIFADNRNELNTLEPQFTDANGSNLNNLIDALGVKAATAEEVAAYMGKHKTASALKVFESDIKFTYPDYIIRAIEWCDE